jgi:hypothetical protein
MIMYKVSTPSLGGKHIAFLMYSLIRLGSRPWAAQSDYLARHKVRSKP